MAITETDPTMASLTVKPKKNITFPTSYEPSEFLVQTKKYVLTLSKHFL